MERHLLASAIMSFAIGSVSRADETVTFADGRWGNGIVSAAFEKD